jgi:superfamily I DNA/RNA helicase
MLRKEISHTVFMEDCLLSKERNKRCFVRLVLNPKDEEALMRVINYPARGIGNTTIEKLSSLQITIRDLCLK